MKWIKASERLPKKTKEYPIKWDSPRPKGNRNFDVAVFGADERWYIYDSEMNDCDEMFATDFMWLDEQPIPVNQDENEFQKYLSTERDGFVHEVILAGWDVKLRVSAENFLIAFDQLRERYSPSPTPVNEEKIWKPKL